MLGYSFYTLFPFFCSDKEFTVQAALLLLLFFRNISHNSGEIILKLPKWIHVSDFVK